MKGLTRLRLHLLESGVTQKRLAEVSKIHPATVSLIASGRLNPDFTQRAKIARALGVDEKRLFE